MRIGHGHDRPGRSTLPCPHVIGMSPEIGPPVPRHRDTTARRRNMDADRRSIALAADHEMGLTRREIAQFSGLAGVGALLATIGVHIREARAQTSAASQGDLKILNVALGLEHEAIAAYQAGAESTLLQKPILDVAVLFQSQHKAHRDALAAAIKRAGGTPVEPRKMSEYTWPRLASQTDVL